MDVHLVAESVGVHRIGDDEDVELTDIGEANNMESSSVVQDEEGIGEPHVGMEFNSENSAKNLFKEYARRIGFSYKIHHKTDESVIAWEFVCSREGFKRRFGCDGMMRIESNGQDKWVVTKFVKEHSHGMLEPNKLHNIHPRWHFNGSAKTMSESCQGTGNVHGVMMYVSMDGTSASVETNNCNVRNTSKETNLSMETMNYEILPTSRKRTLGRDVHNLLEYFKKMQAEKPGFFYAIQLDEDNRMTNVFWADSRSRTAYSYLGDAVTLDTMFRFNQCKVPYASFTGVNHHGQTILFGCALLLDESEASFIWLFKTFLTAMNNCQPVSIITNQGRAIQIAVGQVFPEARHCINKWDVLREGQEKLAHVCLAYPNFQVELYHCINLTETIEEFESSWNLIIEKYDLRRHEWLRSLYNTRAQWVPVYFRDSFFAAISPTQGYACSFFDGYVNHQTTLPMFFRQYERAMENWFEREIEADFDTVCTMPVLSTPSPMEKQTANLYTRKVFAKFQEELVETFVYTANRIDEDGATRTFRVAKFEDDNKAYIVSFNYSELRAHCSCQMFEYSGILCRHVLTVFTVTNVLTLPSHYILKRWTSNAKSGIGADETSGEENRPETLTLRYNRLCCEAIKYAEEGAIAAETYIVASSTLKEATKKVAAVKKNVGEVAAPSSQGSVIGNDKRKTSTSASDTTPLLWPRQDEFMLRHSLNDNGTSSQPFSDLNLPQIAPVSLHRDDSAPDNMVIIPCLKSMTWVMESKNSTHGNRVAVLNLKLQDYSKIPSAEMEVKFQLSSVTLEPMLRSMSYISEQLSTPANRVAVINLKLQDTETSSGESEVKFQVSKNTLGAMLRSMAYIREQLSVAAEPQSEHQPKKQRKRKEITKGLRL